MVKVIGPIKVVTTFCKVMVTNCSHLRVCLRETERGRERWREREGGGEMEGEMEGEREGEMFANLLLDSCYLLYSESYYNWKRVLI